MNHYKTVGTAAAVDPSEHPATWAWSLYTLTQRAQLGGDVRRWWDAIGRARRTELRTAWQRARAAKRDASQGRVRAGLA